MKNEEGRRQNADRLLYGVCSKLDILHFTGQGSMETQHRRHSPKDIRERTFEFACRIVKLHQYLYKKGGTERAIAAQVLRSGTSIGANLEEANAGQTKRDFIAKCSISLKEARETYFWLRLLLTTKLVT